MLRRMGSTINILGKLIPAVNIQVENVPGWLNDNEGNAVWYGVYFEILFEDGSLWIVEQGFDMDKQDEITVGEYLTWGVNEDLDQIDKTYTFDKWSDFLALYLEKVKKR